MPQRLGQHFLKNKSAVKKIVESLDLESGDKVIEIGPGEGALTFPLLEAAKQIGAKVIAIERDHALAQNLESRIKNYEETIKIIGGDALKVLPSLIHDSSFMIHNYKLIGNIPYYITGHLLRIISELENKPELSVLMVQKEVAERICAKPPKMNLLAAITQFWADPELILRLKPEDFDPPPKVYSAVIRLITKKWALGTGKDSLVTDDQFLVPSYHHLVKALFKQPRKTAANNLADGLKITKKEAIDLIKSAGLPENARPQDFSLDKLTELSTTTAKYS